VRVEINFSGDSSEAVISSEEVTRAVRKLFVQAEETARAVQEIRISSAQAAESSREARRMANDIQQIGQEARKSRREIEALKLSGAGIRNPGSGVGPFGSGFGRVGVLGTAIGLGTAVSGPAAGGAAALGVGALSFAGPAAASIGVLVASFHGLGKAIEGDRQAFEKLSPPTQAFVQDIRSLIPWLHTLQETARQGLLPGITSGLHAALTPESAANIQQAIRGISGELGKLANQAGQGLSGQGFQTFLGDLSTHGVTQLDNLGHAAGHFASALLTLDHAGQPVADWLSQVIDDGARFVDEFLKAQQATGGLTAFMQGAKSELQIVGHFLGALVDAAGQLSFALLPLGNQILAALTTALQHLASWLSVNHDAVVAFTTEALKGLVDTVKVAWPIVMDLAKALLAIVRAMGGWQTAFEIVLAGYVVVGINNIAKAVYGLRTALLVANPELALLLATATLLAAFVNSGGTTKFQQQIPGHPQSSVTFENGQWWRQTHTGSRGAGANTRKKITLAEAAAALGTTPEALIQQMGTPSGPGPQSKDPKIGYTDASRQTSTGPDGRKTTFVPGQSPTSLPGSLGNYYVQPVAPGSKFERFDQGIDMKGRPGDYVLAIGNARIDRVSENAGGFGKAIYYTLADGPAAGTQIYVGHAWPLVKAGDNVARGQKIAKLLQKPLGNAAGIPGHVEVGIASGNVPLSKSENDTGSAKGFYAFLHGQQTTPTNTTPPANDPYSKPPPFSGDKGANILPAALRKAMAIAQTTTGAGDDRASIQAAVKWLRANVGGLTGEDQINAYLELASLLGQLKSLAPKVKKVSLASQSSRISARGEQAGLISQLTGDPFAQSLAQPQSLAAAQSHLAAVRRSLLPEIREIGKDLGDKTLTSAALSVLRAQMAQYKKTITSALTDVKAAIERQKSAFQAAWEKIANSAIDALEKQRASYKSPARILLDQLTAAHDTKALNDALDQANTDLATALKGHQADAQSQLDQIRQYVGTAFLTNALDAAQSAILGGDSVQISGAEILKNLQGILAGGNVVDPEEVKRAQQSVEDAKYAIQVAGLEKTAQAEEDAYNASIDAQEAAIREMAAKWEAYFAQFKGNIEEAAAMWRQFLSSIGTNISTAGPDWTGPVDSNGVPLSAGFNGFDANGNWVGGDINSLPSFDVGGPVGRDMVAQLHQGEHVVPKSGALVMGGGGSGDTHVHLHGNIPPDWIKVEIDQANSRISHKQGVSADVRRRAGLT
jgi:hypothetical protein